jgi:hypothetical protein
MIWRIFIMMAVAAALGAAHPALAQDADGNPNNGKEKEKPFSKGRQAAGTGFKGFDPPTLPKKPVDTPHEEDPVFVKARELFWSGSYDQAERIFLSYLEKNPDHEPTKVFLRMISESRHYDPEKEKVVRKALEEVRFKRIDWKEMTLDAAITYLREETRRQIPEGAVVNFVNLVPESGDHKKITLSAEDTSLDDLIKRISELAGVYHHVESDGVVFETKARSI